MKKENNSDFLQLLENIKAVDAPPFLFTRIQQRIKNEIITRVPLRVAYSWAASLCFLVLINVLVVMNYQPDTPHANNLAQRYHLMPENDFYK